MELVRQYLKEKDCIILTDRRAYCKELLENYYVKSFNDNNFSSIDLEQMETLFEIICKELNDVSHNNRKNINPVSRLDDLINTLEIKLKINKK
ncbi:hypothetical protein [Neobacillus niacini]|uniref:hypothetical protein n=1 Tax=Neobacillus niacini TaxID=86668 RepID=UPI00286307E5|nr:hypothetical protein [Neobacillus niacini]MDR7000997.1 hypothetical protein [Neobacillus niacini]